jgi:predicted TPR repeat methyltransferase
LCPALGAGIFLPTGVAPLGILSDAMSDASVPVTEFDELAAAELAAGRPLQALVHLERALAIQPAAAPLLVRRGRAMHMLGRLHEAIDCHSRALTVDPRAAIAYAERARARHELGEEESALADYHAALQLQPERHDWRLAQAVMLGDRNDLDAARQALEQARALGANPHHVEFLLASLGAAAAPASLPGDYVSALFDAYAPRFERHLTRRLNYRAPHHLADALLPLLGSRRWRIADLGCGTGLMGRLLRARADRLEGVDLSAGMIEQARAAGIYDGLHVGDLVAFLDARPQRYDVAIAADVFVYIGDLAPVFAALGTALRPEGIAAFTVEALDEGEYRLQQTRRYAHSRRYIEALAHAHGFASSGITRRTLRRNGDTEISGYVAVFRRRPQRQLTPRR